MDDECIPFTIFQEDAWRAAYHEALRNSAAACVLRKMVGRYVLLVEMNDCSVPCEEQRPAIVYGRTNGRLASEDQQDCPYRDDKR